MKGHPCDCACCHGKKETPRQGVLLPKILCSGREWQRCLCAALCLTDVPEQARPPFTLVSVTQGERAPAFLEEEAAQRPYHLCGRVLVPLRCVVRDACGRCFPACASVEVAARFALHCPRAECWRHTLQIVPCVRMVCAPVESCDCCFDAQLEVLLNLYLVQWTPVYMQKPQPPCPDLPLYPQPFDPRLYGRQCPAAPDPCGWREPD